MTTVIEFDFTHKREREIALSEVPDACRQGRYCWVDYETETVADVREFLHRMEVGDLTLEAIFDENELARFSVFPTCLQFTLREARVVDGDFKMTQVLVVLGPRFLLTFHGQPVRFLQDVHQTYQKDFLEHAQSEGFLLFELADHLTQVYRATLEQFGDLIERTEQQLLGETEDELFREVADLIRSLLEFRKVVISAREIIHELATRRSPFISETTQPFLEKKGVLLERLSADAATEREVLSESLNLYMGIVGYRTNKVLTRLTMLSTIFLPLSFLVGVYGMNFGATESSMPELRWRYGYLMFWIVVVALVTSLLVLFRRKKWF